MDIYRTLWTFIGHIADFLFYCLSKIILSIYKKYKIEVYL